VPRRAPTPGDHRRRVAGGVPSLARGQRRHEHWQTMSEPTLSMNSQASTYVTSQPVRPPIWERTVEEWRNDTLEECLAGAGVVEPVLSVEEIDLNTARARLYRSDVDNEDVLVWIHGGGWIVGDLDCCDALARAISNRAGCAVLSVGYRRAPEFPYRAAVEDCWEAAQWASQRFRRVAVGGDSAGGNLAAGVARRARDAGLDIAMQLLVYPVMDWRVNSPSYDRFVRRYDAEFLEIEAFGTTWRTSVKYLWDIYAPNDSWRVEPDASPLRASSFVGVAPALILTAEHDIFRDEGEEYARRLEADGVGVEVHQYEGQLHGFYHLLGVMSDARDAVEKSAVALRVAFDVANTTMDNARRDC
jgi:acetyl esterase